jgi:branched-chain amino acid aminotransferase
MEGKIFINYNGNIFESDQPVFTSANRAFRYGDALFETIRLMNGEILYLDKHLARLKEGMGYLGMNNHPDLNFHNLYLIIRHLDQINHLKGNGRIRLEVFRNDGGYYRPVTNEVSYVIEAESLIPVKYDLNDQGLRIDVFSETKKPLEKLSNLKTSSALIYVLANLHRKNHVLDDCLLLNASGRIAEAISSSIFILEENNVLKTPSLKEACVGGVMRNHIIEVCKDSMNIAVEEAQVTVDDVLNATEVFLSDVINGIRWVGAFRQKRYYNAFSRQLLKELNISDLKRYSA